MTRVCAVLGTLVVVCAMATPAQAIPITEQTLLATGGDVVVTFVSNAAGYTSELFLDGSSGDGVEGIFNNATTPVGATINLGPFAAGTELVFKLLVQQSGDIFYTGPSSRNLDGMVHALIRQTAGQVLVGFEDLFGGGDFDYNDLVFASTDVSPADVSGAGASVNGVDEPSSLMMFGFGLVALGFVTRRQAVRRETARH